MLRIIQSQMGIKNTIVKDYKKSLSWEIFDKIYQRYDVINSILSLGILRLWRNKLVRLFPLKDNMVALDCATGTGEVMISIMNRYHNKIKSYKGVDLSKNMMVVGKARIQKFPYANKVSFTHASATDIPLDEATIDCVTMAFGIRNIVDYQDCLRDIYRVLVPGGTVMIMEFSLPKNIIIRWFYLLYFRRLLPLIGGLISGDKNAYTYLNKTVETFPYGNAFKKEMEQIGFNVSMTSLTFGIATLYIGRK